MTAKEYLLKYEKADRRAKALRREYQREEELIDAIRSTADIDGLPKGNGIKKRTEERAIRLADKAAELKVAELDALHERQEVAETIFKIKNADQMEILIERYINYDKTWERICVDVNASWGTVHTRHREGLKAVEEIITPQNLV